MGYWMDRAKQLRGTDELYPPPHNEEGGGSAGDIEYGKTIEESAPLQTPPPQPAAAPALPLQPGWLVVYRDQRGVLCGGCDDRQHGMVMECRWDGVAWTVHLTDGQRLPLSSIRSVGKTDGEGRLVAAWSVRAHGYDGDLDEFHDAKKGDSLTQ